MISQPVAGTWDLKATPFLYNLAVFAWINRKSLHGVIYIKALRLGC